MSNPGHAGFDRDYAVLRAVPGCSIDDLKHCYRTAVRSLHPDRNPELAADPVAQDTLRELTTAYRRLSEHHRIFGHLPGEALRRPGADFAGPRVHPGLAARAPDSRRAPRWLVAATVALAAVWLWPPASDRADSTAIDGSGAAIADHAATFGSGDATPTAGSRARALGAEGPVAATVRIGDTKRHVRTVLGPPILATAAVWEYGPSHVRFESGRVVDWYSSPMKPLPVDERSREPGWIDPERVR